MDYESLGATVKKGGNILLDDGIIKLEVLEPVSRAYPGPDPMRPYTDTLCVVRNKNPVSLGARKGTNIPGAVLDLPPLTERDKRVGLGCLGWGMMGIMWMCKGSYDKRGGGGLGVRQHDM